MNHDPKIRTLKNATHLPVHNSIEKKAPLPRVFAIEYAVYQDIIIATATLRDEKRPYVSRFDKGIRLIRVQADFEAELELYKYTLGALTRVEEKTYDCLSTAKVKPEPEVRKI